MRIAFITPEFVTDYPDGGGLGNYLYRMGRLLTERGHNVEVFVSSSLKPRVVMHDGIRVERVPPAQRNVAMKILRRMLISGAEYRLSFFLQARALAAAMERRHRESPFDVVQSADCFAVGLAVRRRAGRIHVVRCSTARDMYNEIDGANSRGAHWWESLERRAMRKADKVFAPSRFVAEHYGNKYGIPVEVLRPPFDLEVAPAAEPPCGLPERFLVHFGQLRRRKGTHWLAEALKRSFEMEPSLRMVWVGRPSSDELGRVLAGLGTHRSKVQALQPLPKPELYALLQRADAAVLPSLVDNLPNTVIESLTLGIPVIGTRGASIDELVEPGVTGELVSPGDVEGLASAVVRTWRGQSAVRKGFTWRGGLAEDMRPEKAVESFLKLTNCWNGKDQREVSKAQVEMSAIVTSKETAEQ
jgi:glycogen(starch) synthase